jgi:hypothetical protein
VDTYAPKDKEGRYDFTPITSPAFGIPLLVVKVTTSGMASSHSVMGGVYKTQEQSNKGKLGKPSCSHQKQHYLYLTLANHTYMVFNVA